MGVPSVGAQGGLPLLGPTAVKRQNYKLHRIDPRGPVGPALRSLCGGRLLAAWEPLHEAEPSGSTHNIAACCIGGLVMRLMLRGLRGAQCCSALKGAGAPRSRWPPLKQGLRNVAPAGWIKRRPGYLLLSICIGYLKYISPIL